MFFDVFLADGFGWMDFGRLLRWKCLVSPEVFPGHSAFCINLACAVTV